MDPNTHQQIKEILSNHNHIGIAIADANNIDYLAAGLGLYLSLKQIGKSAVVATPSNIPVSTMGLIGSEYIKRTLGGEGGDLTVSFPYQEGEIEKVSYTLDNGYLNIVVKASNKGLSFQEKEVLFKRMGKPLNAIFFIGVTRLPDLGNFYNQEMVKDAVIVNIDNKATNQQYGDIVAVSPSASSVSEQIADLLTLMDNTINIDSNIAQNLLSGIVHATNDFTNPNTSHLAFEMAGILMRKGAKRRAKHLANDQEVNNTFIPSQVENTVQSSHEEQKKEITEAPADWLAPKVYKGSTTVK